VVYKSFIDENLRMMNCVRYKNIDIPSSGFPLLLSIMSS